MALSSTSVKYILIGAALVLVGLFVVSLVWEGLKIALGVLIGGALIWLGFRFLMGKGLPKGVEKAAKKVIDVGKAAAADEKKSE
jgi:sulfite exporter TauE/SafE